MLCTMIKIGQYNCIKRTVSSEFKALSRDSVSIIRYKMQMLMYSLDPTLDFMSYLEHHKVLKYLLKEILRG